MGIFIQNFVRVDISIEDAGLQAQKIEHELIQREIIEPLPHKTDSERNIKYYSDIGTNSVQLIYPEYRQWFCSDRYVGSKRHVGYALGIGVAWQYAYPVNAEALQCPRCDALNDFNKVWLAVESYLCQRNPSDSICDTCGYTSNLLDWNADPPFAVGHLAIHLDSWPSLSDDGLAYFKQLLGGDTRYLACKF
jgi:hypothetical protein